MANTIPNLNIPGEMVDSGGKRSFDFDQLKIYLQSLGSVASATYVAGNASNASIAAAYDRANAAIARANSVLVITGEAYSQANTATELADHANTVAYYAIEVASSVLNSINANDAANLVAVYADGELVIANANLNFITTNTVNVNISSSSANGQANVGFDANVTAIVGPTADIANTAYDTANAAGALATIANATANLAYGQANAANALANTANSTATQAYGAANLAYTAANLAIIQVTSANSLNISAVTTNNSVVIDLVANVSSNSGGATGPVVNSYSVLANANQSVFVLSANVPAPEAVITSINGLVQVPILDYTTANNILTFSTGLRANDVVEVRLMGPSFGIGGGGNTSSSNTYVLQEGEFTSGIVQTSADNVAITVDSFPANKFALVKYVLLVTTTGAMQGTEGLVLQNGIDAQWIEYATLATANTLGDFTFTLANSMGVLTFTPDNPLFLLNTIKVLRQAIDA